MSERFTMQELMGMTSEDLEVLQDKAWDDWVKIDRALKAVKLLESEVDSE